MNLDAITTQTRPGEHKSLALALRAVGMAAGADLDCDELSAALGIPLVAIAGTAESSPETWPGYTQDAFLTSTARLFGMHLRDLHPPDVGVDMLWAEEFPQHFELSYKPLIHRALENGQPVLAWRGWEGLAAPCWGILTAASGETLFGVVPGIDGRLRLVKPSLQCYVVEQFEARTPEPQELLFAAVAHADLFLSRPEAIFRRPAPSGPKIVTGPAAYDVWAAWLHAQRPGSDGDPAREAYAAYASTLCAARLSAMRFLQRTDAVRGPDHAAMLDAVCASCRGLVEELALLCRPDEIRVFWSTAEGHQELLEAIRAAQAIDRKIAEAVHRLASSNA